MLSTQELINVYCAFKNLSTLASVLKNTYMYMFTEIVYMYVVYMWAGGQNTQKNMQM